MNKIKITFEGRKYDFTYYQSLMDTGRHVFCVVTDDTEAISLLQLDHFFIDIDIVGSSQIFINLIRNTPEEVAFKQAIADKVLGQHYDLKENAFLN